jgi:hypothetical protein
MLHQETDRQFIVYPSWTELPAKWEDLPRLFADPLHSGFLPQRRFDPHRSGWQFPVQPYELTSGPEGGGLIVWFGKKSHGGWLPSLIVGHEASMPYPNSMDSYSIARHEANPDECSVCYIEPSAPGSANSPMYTSRTTRHFSASRLCVLA